MESGNGGNGGNIGGRFGRDGMRFGLNGKGMEWNMVHDRVLYYSMLRNIFLHHISKPFHHITTTKAQKSLVLLICQFKYRSYNLCSLYSSHEIIGKSIFSIKQDIGLLSDNIVPLGARKIKEIFDKKGLTSDDIDYFLPHMSSEFFKPKIFEQIALHGAHIPYEKWFVNLSTMGNVGAGSAYLMVHELFHSGKLKKGDRLLVLVPESSRFSYMYAMLTVC